MAKKKTHGTLEAIVSRWCSFATDTQPLTSLKNTQNTNGLLLFIYVLGNLPVILLVDNLSEL